MSNPRDDDYQLTYLLGKADQLYKKGDYEGALMFYSKGVRIKPRDKTFTSGVTKCEQALDRINPGRWKGANAATEDRTYHNEQTEDPRGAMVTVSPPTSPPPLPKPPNPKGVKFSKEDYPHLNGRELWLLQQGMTLFKNKEYDLALEHYEAGNELKPDAEEFQFGIFLCEGKLKKDAERRDGLIKNMPPPKVVSPVESTQSRSKSVRELEDQFTHRFTFLLNQSKVCYGKGDFHGSFLYADRGMELMPRSVNFQRAKDEAHEGMLIALGAKRPSDDIIRKFVILEIVKAQQFMNDAKYEQAIEQCKTTIERVTDMYKEKLEDKPTLMATCMSIAGNCYLELNEEQKALAYHLQDLDVGNKYDLEDVKARALVNLGVVYARMGNYQKAIQMWTEYIDYNYKMSQEHKSWTYHEIGHCYLECEDLQNAFKYAEYALNAAVRAKNLGRKYGAAVLFGRVALRASELVVARTSFERALDFAEEANDPEGKQRIVTVLEGIDEVMKEVEAEKREGRRNSRGESNA